MQKGFFMKQNLFITPVILAGGSGARLWPMSRKKLPKQFHALLNKETLFQKTILRLNNLQTNRPVVICNDVHKFIIKEQLEKINRKCDILLEPVSRNTAPAITLVSLLQDSKTNLLVLSADHFIENETKFLDTITKTVENFKSNKIVIFGAKPLNPNTNYGYIETKKFNKFDFEVLSFTEKPDVTLAESYFNKKNYFWNTGIFLFNVKTFLEELKSYNPEILNICKKTVKSSVNDSLFTTFNKEIFYNCPNISIDYAVMEHTKKAIMVPLNTNWSDIGNWHSLMKNLNKNEDNNVLKGRILTDETKNSLIFNLSDKLIVTKKINNLIIVDTKDALLILPNKDNINLKDLTNKIDEIEPRLTDTFPDENRPWGSFQSFVKEDGYHIKKLIVKPNGQLSLQKHRHRSEHWVIIKGKAEITKGKEKVFLNMNESIFIPKGTTHSIKNNGYEDLIIIEVQTGLYLEEDDIERFEDVYGRV